MEWEGEGCALLIDCNLNPNLFLHEGNKSEDLIWLWLQTMNCVKIEDEVKCSHWLNRNDLTRWTMNLATPECLLLLKKLQNV